MPRKYSRTSPAPHLSQRRWHVYNRGKGGSAVFREDADRDLFLELLSELTRGSFAGSVGLFSACLLSTHFHLVIEARSDAALARFMQRLIATYAVYYRKKYGGSGPLFSGPYRRRRITDDRQLRWTIAYVHDNHPSGVDYAYSTHRFYESGIAPSWLMSERGLALFGGPDGYRSYMERKASRKEIDREFFAGGRRVYD